MKNSVEWLAAHCFIPLCEMQEHYREYARHFGLTGNSSKDALLLHQSKDAFLQNIRDRPYVRSNAENEIPESVLMMYMAPWLAVHLGVSKQAIKSNYKKYAVSVLLSGELSHDWKDMVIAEQRRLRGERNVDGSMVKELPKHTGGHGIALLWASIATGLVVGTYYLLASDFNPPVAFSIGAIVFCAVCLFYVIYAARAAIAEMAKWCSRLPFRLIAKIWLPAIPVVPLLISYAEPHDLHDDYFIILRVIVCVWASLYALTIYHDYKRDPAWKALAIIAVIYNPFLHIAFGRDIWLWVNTLTIGIIGYCWWRIRSLQPKPRQTHIS